MFCNVFICLKVQLCPAVHNPQFDVGSALTRQLLPEWAISKIHYTRIYLNYIIASRRNSSLGTATALRVEPSAVRIPVGKRRFSLL